MPPVQFIVSAMAYAQLLHRLGVKSIIVHNIPLHELQMLPS